jgi:hypothetical protein
MRYLVRLIRWFLPRSVGDERTIHELHEELEALQQRERENRQHIEALERLRGDLTARRP